MELIMRYTQKIIFTILGIFLLTGCSNISSTIDNNISIPPSWSNIIPGKTTSSEAMDILQNMANVEQNTIDVATEQVGYRKDSISWLFEKGSSDSRGEIYIHDNVVWLILITPKENQVDFKDVINLLGEPKKVFAGSIPNQPIVTWLLYPEDGIAFNHVYGYIETGEGAKIQPKDGVLEVYYFSPNEFQNMFVGSDLFPVSLHDFERTAQEWDGYNKKLPVIIK
jgi:hypothetical protein